MIDTISAEKPKEQPTLTEAELQVLLLDKLDLSGLEAWPTEQAEKVCGFLWEYHDIFSLEKHDMGHTKATKHKIVLNVMLLHCSCLSLNSFIEFRIWEQLIKF